MKTEIQLKVLVGKKLQGRPGFKKEKTTTKSCLFDVIFDVYTQVDNRERARATD